MTENEMTEKIFCLVSKTLAFYNDIEWDMSELIHYLVEQCKHEICAYLGKEYNENYDYICIDMVICRYNRLGSEGIVSHSFSGASETYLENYPEYIMWQLDRYKKKWGLC